MQFEPNRSAETLGACAGFLFSYLLATAILTTVYSFMHSAWAFWAPAYAYFAVVVLIVLLIGAGIRRLLR
jgi:hypothetical protein